MLFVRGGQVQYNSVCVLFISIIRRTFCCVAAISMHQYYHYFYSNSFFKEAYFDYFACSNALYSCVLYTVLCAGRRDWAYDTVIFGHLLRSTVTIDYFVPYLMKNHIAFQTTKIYAKTMMISSKHDDNFETYVRCMCVCLCVSELFSRHSISKVYCQMIVLLLSTYLYEKERVLHRKVRISHPFFADSQKKMLKSLFMQNIWNLLISY